MKYLTFEGEDLKKIQSDLKKQYGDEVLILNVEQKKRGILKKKNYYSVLVGIEDDLLKNAQNLVRKKNNINKRNLNENEGEKENLLFDSNKDNDSLKNDKRDGNNSKSSIYIHAKNIIEEKSKLINSKTPIFNYPQNLALSNDLKDFFSTRLEEIENKIEILIKNKKENNSNDKNISLIDKYCDSLFNFDFSLEYINYLKEKFKNTLSFNEAQSIDIIRNKVYEEIEKNITISNNNLEKGDVVVLVGPTGVGKTTTLVKLASQYRVYKDMSIKFLTIDQYKIGAIDHLNNYADILKTKCEVVRSKDDLIKGIVDNVDLIFVDTLGTSQKDNQHLAIIKDRLDIKKKKLKIYLTISATTKYSDIIDIMERFKFLNYESVIFTKLDETNSFGQVVSSLWKFNIPVSFLTNGQDILETLIIPDKKKIMDILFQGERIYD